jgi:hypothetical protein
MSISDLSMSDPDPSINWYVIGPPHTCMDITGLSLSLTSWDD